MKQNPVDSLRNPVKPMERARTLATLYEAHLHDVRAVARACGCATHVVHKMMSLLQLVPELQEAVDERTLPLEVGFALAKKTPEEQCRITAEILRYVLGGAEVRDDDVRKSLIDARIRPR